MYDNKKVVIIGTGFVGMSCAYSLLNQNACDELVLIDINSEKARGEAMDLNHSLAFSPAEMKIYSGKYSDCRDADIIVIAAGVNQKEGETRIDLLKRNKNVFQSIIQPVIDSGFEGIFLIATNPVDIMSYITKDLSGFDKSKVIGTGTSLDTARLRYLLGHFLDISPKNIHAYVLGEHGDSEMITWSQATAGTKPILSICKDSLALEKIANDVKYAANEIIKAKNATYYGIGMALVRIIKAILNNENSIITVSAYLDGEFGFRGIYAGVPSVINRDGVREIVEIKFADNEFCKFTESCNFLKSTIDKIKN
ncbi:MAG: L-lactate dehydrogenase [Clostridia bacterium]|nr:L-lactate dehydrogenase [Clostridia bacterium]